MSRMTSPSTERRYPLATICLFWGLSRATRASAPGKRRTNCTRPGAVAPKARPATPTCWRRSAR